MSLPIIVLYVLVALAVAGGLGVLLTRSVFKAAIALLICLLAVAGIYVLTFAEFVAVAQVLIYAGGVVVLILFGIMLTSKTSMTPFVSRFANVGSGLFLMIALLSLLWSAIGEIKTPATSLTNQPVTTIGTSLMTGYALPFELTGIILLLALIGAAVSSIKTDKPRSDDRRS